MSELTPYICVADCPCRHRSGTSTRSARRSSYEPIVMDDGRVGHCELAVDGARWMMSDEFESAGVARAGPRTAARRSPST